MSDEHYRNLPPVVTLASIQASITVLSVSVGRLEERLHAMDKGIEHHTTHEHQAFNEALETIEEIKQEVRQLSDMVQQGKGVRLALGWVAAAAASLAAGLAWMISEVIRK